MVLLGGLSIGISIVGLYILLFSSFKCSDKQQITSGIIIKSSRKIRVHRENKTDEQQENSKPNPQFVLLLETIIIAELVGLFFLWLTDDHMKHTVLAINGATFLVASFLCSVLTLFNAWLKKKMHLLFRIILQLLTLIIGILLLIYSTDGKAEMPSDYMANAIDAFYITVVIALVTMLFNVMKGNNNKEIEFNYNNYLILVIASGLIIGSGLLIATIFITS